MSITKSIISGELDAELDAINEAVKQRRKLIRGTNAVLAMSEINIGDRVVLKGLRPKYVNGEKGTVQEKKNTRIILTMDRVVRRFGKYNVTVPARCVDKIVDQIDV